jgi:hypothetical protein
MNRVKFIGVIAAVFIGLISLQGCTKPAGRTDFLASPMELMPCPESKEKLWWERPSFNWHSYKKVIIDPIAVVGDAAVGDNAPERAEILEMEQYFQKSVAEKLAPEFAVVREPGPDVLRIRPAITRVDRANPLVNVVTTAAVFIPLDMGGASIEVEFLDSLTGERLAAMVETKSGTPLQLIASLSQYGHAENAMDDWASELKIALLDNP